MTSVLHALSWGLPLDAVRRVIPPACRGVVETAAPAASRRDGEDVLVETPAWPAIGALQFVPALSALHEAAYDVRLELAVRADGQWSPWVAGAALGSAAFAPLPAVEAIEVDVDVFRVRAPVEAVRLRARIRAASAGAVLSAPWLLSLSAATAPASVAVQPTTGAPRLDVPALSQMDAAAAIASRVCSPACVAMVLGYLGQPVSLGTLAAEIFHPPTDLYGVWPAAILAAGRRGVPGYLLRFPDWASAAWCLARRLPVIASLRYRAGELTGAAVAETPGHLIVLTGSDDGHAFVNDPAAPASSVTRQYRIADLTRVWLERSGIGYVLFPPTTSSP